MPRLVPFTGELMRCVVCGEEERSSPSDESQWRCMEIDGTLHYACPNEFPPDGSPAERYEVAYTKVMAYAIASKLRTAGRPLPPKLTRMLEQFRNAKP